MASHDRIARVTGASRGIGAACATALLADGWRVVFAARDRQALDRAIADAGHIGERAVAMTVDVCDRASIDTLFAGISNGSLAAFAPRPESVAYTATKHGVLGLTRAASLDGGACGIAVGQIDIGNAATAMAAHVEQGALQADGSMRPEVRMDLKHVAAAVVTLARMPNEASIQSLTLLPTTMPFVGRG